MRIEEMPLAEWEVEVFEVNSANGWFDSGRSFGTDLALLHSEVSEMFEAYRDGGLADQTAQPIVDPDKLEELSGGVVAGKPIKPEGVGSEAADILIRLLDHAYRHELFVPLAHATALEMQWTRLEEFGDWIAVLHKAIADIEGTPVSSPWSAYCATLSALYAGCGWWEIDLPAEYTRKIAFNRTRGYKHGGKSV